MGNMEDQVRTLGQQVIDGEYEEPTNEQLAKFMVVYAPRIVGEDHDFALDPALLERLMDVNPIYRAGALRHHRKFVEETAIMFKKLERGQLQCEHIRPNGKKCVNFNQPGSFFCGLHQDDAGEEQDRE